MTDWRKLLTDEHLWDYRCKAVPVPLVREIVEEVETLRQDLAAAKERIVKLEELLKEASNDWVPHSSNLSAAIVDLLHIPPPSPWRDRDD